jgi:transposase
MAMGKRTSEQAPMWVAATDLPVSPSHPFYARLNTILDEAGFDRFAEEQCQPFYAPVMGRPGLPPGRYFRLLLVGYFEGLDSERGIAWRAADSLAVRSFVGLGLDTAAPDHSTISRTRRLIDVETHRAIFTWVQERLAAADLLKGRTVAIDATTLEANAAMRSIIRRDTGETYQEFLTRLAETGSRRRPVRRWRGWIGTQEADVEHGLDEPARSGREGHEDEGWPDAPRAQAEHATISIAARWRCLAGADMGDTTSLVERPSPRPNKSRRPRAPSGRATEPIADKCIRINVLIDLRAVSVRSHIWPDRGRRHWTSAPDAQHAVYGNRRRLRGRRGKRLMRRRGEYVERSFAHVYDTGGMRRTHLRGHPNILKRLLIHASAFNLGILMRKVVGVGAPRQLQGAPLDVRSLEIAIAVLYEWLWEAPSALLAEVRLVPRVSSCHSALAIA